MEEIYLRVISFSYDNGCLQRIKNSFLKVCSELQIANINFSEIKPYWKIDGYGELDINFLASSKQFAEIKPFLSDNWVDEVTDSRWAKIFCEDIHFMWLTNKNK